MSQERGKFRGRGSIEEIKRRDFNMVVGFIFIDVVGKLDGVRLEITDQQFWYLNS